MGSEPGPSSISVVVTVRNEEPNLAGLLDSLNRQAPPFEVIVVDAESRDRSFEIAEEYVRRDPSRFRAYRRRGLRGVGRNEGVAHATGEFVAFIDGDCVADPGWLAALRGGLAKAPIAAGRTVSIGRARFQELERVELYLRGSDVTYPSCNLAYPRELFRRLGGFDPHFVTAEDIDLNLRAVDAGAEIRYVPDALVLHRTRPSFARFLIQAYWNGYGRKQLTEKHGDLWGRYRPRRLLETQRSPIALVRLAAASAGYAGRIVRGRGHRLSP